MKFHLISFRESDGVWSIHEKAQRADKNDSSFASPPLKLANNMEKKCSSETISVIWRFRSKHHKFLLRLCKNLGFYVFRSRQGGGRNGKEAEREREMKNFEHLSLSIKHFFLLISFLEFLVSFSKKKDAGNVSRLEWPPLTSLRLMGSWIIFLVLLFTFAREIAMNTFSYIFFSAVFASSV